MTPFPITRACALAVAVACAVTPLAAQEDICRPLANSNEAKTFGLLSIPIAFSGAGVPARAHGISFGLEFATLPTVDSQTAKPTSCRPGKEAENTNPLPGLVRPRVAVGAAGFLFEVAWIPPVRVNEVKANLVGLALARPFPLSSRWYASVRAHAVFGSLHAPITCDDDAIANPASECYLGTRSDDRWRPGVFGVEGTVGAGRGHLQPYFGAGYTLLRPRFRVNFTNAAGTTDNRQVVVNLQRVAVFGGLTWTSGVSSATVEAYSTPADGVSGRLLLRTTIRK